MQWREEINSPGLEQPIDFIVTIIERLPYFNASAVVNENIQFTVLYS